MAKAAVELDLARADASSAVSTEALANLQIGLAQANQALAQAGVSLRIELRGQRLGLRGPLPCRRGSGRHPVQRISLGLPADTAGLELARERLKEVLRQLQQGRFAWSAWGVQQAQPPSPSPSTSMSSSKKGFRSGPAMLDTRLLDTRLSVR